MEIVLQYLDDLDDLVATVGLLSERIRRLALFFVFSLAALMLQLAAVWSALKNPPLALAAALVLCVALALRAEPHPPD